MTTSGDQSQQQTAAQEAEPKDHILRASETFGTDPSSPVTEQLADPATLSRQICTDARTWLSDSSLYEIHESYGRRYRISIGSEHFADTPGSLDHAQRTIRPKVNGFRLFQELPRKGEDTAKPVYIVMNENVNSPIAAIRLSTDTINARDSINTTEDIDSLFSWLEITSAILKDSCERRDADVSRRDFEKGQRRRSIKRRVIGLTGAIAAAAVIAGGIFAGLNAYNSEQARLEDEQVEAEADARAEQRAADKAEASREAEVQRFDSRNDIATETVVSAGNVAIAEASDQFVDVNVPDFKRQDIDESLAQDIRHPREIKANRDEACTILNMPIKKGEQFKVTHNGNPEHIYNVVFDEAKDRFVVCEAPMPDVPHETGATSFYIQRANS